MRYVDDFRDPGPLRSGIEDARRADETAIIATTGKCGRELFTIADRPQHLYQVGSMGGASGMGWASP